MNEPNITTIIINRIDRLEDGIIQKLDHLLALGNDHESRLTAIESIEIQQLSERVHALERDKSHLKGMAAGVAVASAFGGGTVAALLGDLIR
jgi:low affinity Fe/Cu permease